MYLNLGELKLDNPEEVIEILTALKAAGLRISNIQIKGNRQQVQQFFSFLPKAALSKQRAWQKAITSMVPAALSGISVIVLAMWLWI